MNVKRILLLSLLGFLPASAIALTLSQSPLNLSESGTPLIMLTMERDHKLYYEAYNDASDINGDGILDIHYNPAINYFGYFDSHKCYSYGSGKFTPAAITDNKQCSGAWSGDYLNYLTMSRMDALRRVLYGGKRSTDDTATVLERSYIPQDAHSWGKEYTSTAVDGYDISLYTPLSQPATGTRHLFANTTLLCPSGNSDPGCNANSGLPLLRMLNNTAFRVWEWLSIERPVAGVQCATGNNSRSNCAVSSSSITDYVVRVDACVSGFLENECRGYPANNPTVYKPGGILQQYGETDRMAFGLITGSYQNNVSGGVLRKNISSLTDEINADNGRFTSTNGIIKTIDALKIVGFGGSYEYNQSCSVPEVGGPLAEGRCRMWGNPTAEMMYEGLRYFAGKASPTYSIATSGNDDSALGLPLPAWVDPYRSSGGYPVCSKPSQLVISDINPNFDTDQLPGRHGYTLPSPTPSFTGDVTSLDVEALADSIWGGEYGSNPSLFIGQSGETYDGAPTAKTVTSFGNIRGLSPEEPTQQGGYYAASIGLFGKTHDLNAASGDQKTDTFSVALASPLPRISFPLNGENITLVPFAKTVGGCGGVSSAQGSYQPTNTIVDFYVDTIKNTSTTNRDTTVNGGLPYAKFRINFEDSEYGSDHDMDAIAEYELTAKIGNTVDIKLSSTYAAGGCIQHMGYVISGTSTDGTYLEVRDPDTAAGSDVDYYLDTPNSAGVALPTSTTRNFSIGANTSAAFVAHDPLWYAAKWGGFIDSNNNNLLDATEWDNRDGADGVPDSYFLVTNAGKLKEQLEKAFTEILARDSSASAVATNSTSLKTQSRVYQARFNSLEWSGQLLSYQLSASGVLNNTPEWDAGSKINAQNPTTGRVIITKGATGDGVPFTYENLTGPTATAGTQMNLLDKDAAGITDNCGLERVAYLRGDGSDEAANGTFTCASSTTISNFRQRSTSKLGDIVNSNPWYVGAPSAGLSDVDYPGYSAFRRGKLTRKPVVYTGGNDGMLHGFDASLDTTTVAAGVPTATSGNEVLAYIPSAVFPNLSKLTARTYNQNHLYFVDGSPMVGDAYLTSLTSWHTVLVGAMGAGGKGYYALDITDPSLFSESNAADILLWEFNDAVDADMGYAFNLPPVSPVTGQAKQIVRMANGKWAVIVGNGYNSSSGKAVLYILFINEGMDGAWSAGDYVKIVADAPTGLDNGLSTPVPYDSNEDGFVDTVYAGDLKGNMWKFLVGPNSSDTFVDSTTSTWKVAFSDATCANATPSTCSPLFKATDSGGLAQPIIWPPEVALHPNGGQMILFGTGKYIETNDKTNTHMQTFYGIWDRHVVAGTGTPVGARATDLLQQTVTESVLTGGNFRIPSNTAINWRPASGVSAPANCTSPCTPTHMGWYMDLPTTGERTTGIPKLINQVIFFNTLIPSSTICLPGTGWLMSLDYLSGGLAAHQIFDTGGNGVINGSDVRAGGLQVGAALGGTTLIQKLPSLDSGNVGVGVSSLISGNLSTDLIDYGIGSKGRLSWREIMPNNN